MLCAALQGHHKVQTPLHADVGERDHRRVFRQPDSRAPEPGGDAFPPPRRRVHPAQHWPSSGQQAVLTDVHGKLMWMSFFFFFYFFSFFHGRWWRNFKRSFWVNHIHRPITLGSEVWTGEWSTRDHLSSVSTWGAWWGSDSPGSRANNVTWPTFHTCIMNLRNCFRLLLPVPFFFFYTIGRLGWCGRYLKWISMCIYWVLCASFTNPHQLNLLHSTSCFVCLVWAKCTRAKCIGRPESLLSALKLRYGHMVWW